ncbi:MAG: hypothetical protein M5U01_23965 [Ardenticatenaceae bacterium]|nr:hypothetical protein [Ardenticatenaceae bacterium]
MAVLSAALYSDDPVWAMGICLRLARHSDAVVRGNAVLGLGHIARIHRQLDLELVRPVVVGALADDDEYVRGQAESAVDDIEFFLKCKLRPQKGV